MARKRIGAEPLTAAEKQKHFRERMKAKGYTERHIWLPKETPTPDLTGIDAARPAPDADREAKRLQWESDFKQALQAEKLKAARKAGREGERRKFIEKGYILAAVTAANVFLRGERYSADIAKMLLKKMNVDRKRATAAGGTDYSLSALDKACAWGEPPPELMR